MFAQNSNGYDSAQARQEGDDLDRWRFAAEITEVILATPPDWSARIGIFGKWGDGKSTVLRFAEQMLREKENVVFWFSPWAIQNWNDLWEDFGNGLLEALSAAGIPFDGSWKKSAKDSGKWLESKGMGQIGEVAAALFGKEKAYNAAFGVLSRWLKLDGAQIRAIREKLGNRRLVVLIDDLDRCSPALLPQLLLSLRELLDLPGFTFLLAFDDEIVSRALAEENPAWVVGSDFLDKILDFRFHLPAITDLQKERFVYRAMDRYCPFVPKDSVKEIQDLLPNNPRKLKALIRSLSALQPQIARHDPDELNWVDMWLAQMLRLESYAFFERLLKGKTLDEEVGTLYQLTKDRHRNRLESEGKDRNESLRRLIKEVGVENQTVVQRLIQLIEAIRARASSHFSYVCQLVLRPHAVTWKEFRSFYAAWVADRKVATLSCWIERHAKERNVSVDDVENELFETIMIRRDGCLRSASESASTEEHDSWIDEARILLELIEQDLLGLGEFGASRFKKLYGQVGYWIGFRRNPTDKTLRAQEDELLLRLLSWASEALSTELLEVIVPDPWYPDIDDGFALKEALREKCEAIASPKASEEAIKFFAREGGIQSLTERGRFMGVKYCLFRPDSPIWKSPLKEKLLALINSGRENFLIYANVRDFFNLLVQGLQGGMETIDRKGIAVVLSDTAFVQNLWEIVTSRAIQYRMQISFIRARQVLIKSGISESILPLTEELRLRLVEEESRARMQVSANRGSNEPLIPGETTLT